MSGNGKNFQSAAFSALLVILTSSVGLAENKVMVTTTGGRKPSPQLKMKKSNVPTFEIHKNTKSIPRLDIGEEPTLQIAELQDSQNNQLAPVQTRTIQKLGVPHKIDLSNSSKKGKTKKTTSQLQKMPKL